MTEQDGAPPVATGRGALRLQRRRQRRRAVAVALALAVLAAVLVVVYFAGRDTSAPGAAAPPRAVLVQLLTPGRPAVSAVLAADVGRSVSALLVVPPQLAAPGGVPVSRAALAGVLGVDIEATWVLDSASAARLVDGVGDVAVRVDVAVPGPSGTLLPGRQPLDGGGALAFAGYLAPGEGEPATSARGQAVLDALLRALPGSPPQVAGLLETLGAGSSVDGTQLEPLAATLAAVARDSRGAALRQGVVPLLAAAGSTGAAQPDVAATGRLVAGLPALVARRH